MEKKKDPSEVKIPSADILFLGKMAGLIYTHIMLEEK